MQRRPILICTFLTVALAAWVVPAQSQVVPRDFDGDGVITPTDYVEELLSLYKGRTAPGLPVVEFSLIDLNGNAHTPVFYKDKVLLLWFLGYDCTGCLAAAPELEERIHLRNADKEVQILGLDIWNGSAAQLATFRFTTRVTMPMLQQASNPDHPFGMDISQIAVVDRDGIVRGIYGEEDFVDVNQMVDLILAQAPFAAWSPSSLYYGMKTEVGDRSVITIILRNEGAVDLVVTAIRSSNPDLTLDLTELTIPPASTAEVVATFIPSSEGTLSAQVTMVTNDPNRGNVVIPLDEILVEAGLLGVVAVPETNLALGEIDFGRSGTTSFTIRNDGQGPLQVTRFESDLAGVSFSATSLTILPGASETVTVTVDPSVEGPFSGTIDVLSNDPTQGTLSIPLTGTAVVIPADPRADFDANNTVDFVDFLLFAAAFGTSDSKFDISGNGVVDFSDFLVFAENFGKQVN